MSSPKSRRITTSLMALALVIQALYGLIQAPLTYAATPSIVSPDSLRGWLSTDIAGNGGSVDFVNTQGSLGSGSAQFGLPAADQAMSLHLATHGGTKLADLTTLSYDSFTVTEAAVAPSLVVAIDKDVTDDDTSSAGQLMYSPYENGQVIPEQWQGQNARDGLWWFSKQSDLNMACFQLKPCSLNMIITLYPNVGIAPGSSIGLIVKNSGGEPSISYADNVVINDNIYNFEAISAPLLSAPVHGSILNDSTLEASWQAVSSAATYVYESYDDEAATQLRVSEVTTEPQKSETGLVADTSVWWRVKAVDGQGNAGNWSELWKVSVAAEPEVAEDDEVVTGGGVVSGGGHGQTQELLTQLARLKEPFAVPDPVDPLVVPNILNEIDTARDVSDIAATNTTDSPVAGEEKTAVPIDPTESGWKLFGVLWYWWVLPAALLGYGVARIAIRSSPRTFLYSSDQI